MMHIEGLAADQKEDDMEWRLYVNGLQITAQWHSTCLVFWYVVALGSIPYGEPWLLLFVLCSKHTSEATDDYW